MNAPILLDKKPPGVVLSPSQIGRWDLCQRWWAWEYIAKIRGAPHPSAILGSAVHAKLERWLLYAEPPRPYDDSEREKKATAIATRMVATLTENGILPGSGAVENAFWFRTQYGHQYTGFIDWRGVAPLLVNDYFQQLPTITDHKTSGSLEWAKTEADLHNDIQAVIYAIAGFLGFGTDTLQLFWNYGETQGRNPTKAVKTVVHLPVIAEKFERVIEPAAAEILWHRERAQHPLSFPPNAASCGAFGGCPHRERCNLTPQQQMQGAFMNQPTMADKMGGAPTNGVQQQLPQPGQYAQQQGAPQPQQQYAQPQQQQAPQLPQPQPGQQPQQYAQPQQQQAPQLPQPQQYAQPQQQQAPQLPQPQPGQQPQYGQPQGLPQPQQAPQQAYAPTVGPNPPESGHAQLPAPEGGKESKAGPGRPKGSGKKTLTIEQQIFLAGAGAAISNPSWDGSQERLVHAGDAALAAYKAKFG